jgi:hypothetical protein
MSKAYSFPSSLGHRKFVGPLVVDSRMSLQEFVNMRIGQFNSQVFEPMVDRADAQFQEHLRPE